MDETKQSVMHNLSANSRNRFLLFITLSLIVSGFLVIVSMFMYNSSGAAQLDLSRPGYIDVRSQAVNSDSDFQNYSSTGSINQDSINEFKSIFDQQAQKIKVVDAFSGDPLNPGSLGIGSEF